MLDSLATSTLEVSVLADGVEGVRLVLRGELDLAVAPELAVLLDSPVVVDAAGLVLDLGALDFLDLAGLRVLVAARERVVPPARVVLGGSRTRRIFDLTGNGFLVDDPLLVPVRGEVRGVEAAGRGGVRLVRAGARGVGGCRVEDYDARTASRIVCGSARFV